MQKFRDRFGTQKTINGKRRWFLFDTKEECKRFEHEFALGLASFENDSSQNPAFREFAVRWLDKYSKAAKSANSHDDDKSRLKRHVVGCGFYEKPIKELKKADLIELKEKLLSKKSKSSDRALNPKTINHVLVICKSILDYAVELDLLRENPWKAVKRCKVKSPKFDFWMPSERDAFYEGAFELNPTVADLALLACHTGLRRGELAALTWKSVDFERRKLEVAQSYSVRLKKFGPTKNGEIEEVSLNEVAFGVLQRRFSQKKSPSIFPIHVFGNLIRDFKALTKRVGVNEIRFHDTRHTFGSCLAMAGVDLMVIQKLMRHKSYQMTLRYAHLHPTHLEGATDVLCGAAHKPAHKTVNIVGGCL